MLEILFVICTGSTTSLAITMFDGENFQEKVYTEQLHGAYSLEVFPRHAKLVCESSYKVNLYG